MSRPVLLDLFGCEGGAAAGYHAAGWEVWSVDNAPARHRRNPHGWYLGDWQDGLDRALHTGQVQAVHASPVCKGYTRGNASRRGENGHDSRHPAGIAPVRDALQATGLPYVIENVQDAARKGFLRADLTLCGSMFGLCAGDTDGEALRLERHRCFESNVLLLAPGPCRHDRSVRVAGSYGGARRNKWEAQHIRHGGYVPAPEVQRALLGAPAWMSEQGMYESLPPAYTRHIGEQLLDYLRAPTPDVITARRLAV